MSNQPTCIAHMAPDDLARLTPEQMTEKIFEDNLILKTLRRGYQVNILRDIQDCIRASNKPLLDILERLCNGLAWNIENHPTVMNEADCEALTEARALLERARDAARGE